MNTRRTFLKAVRALPLLFLGKEAVKPEFGKADETVKPEINSDFPVFYQYWHGRWWRAQGNKVEWTEYHGIWLEIPSKEDFVHWNILPCDIDYCEVLIPDREVLLWIGRREVWEIEYDYCFGLKEFMFKFQYKCDRKYLNVMIHYDFGFME